MDKELGETIVSTLFSLFCIAFGIIATAITLVDTSRHVAAVRNNIVVEGTVQDIHSEIVSGGRHRSRKKVYTISFLYEYDGQKCAGKFKTSIPGWDALKQGEALERRYRIGSTEPLLLAPDWSPIVFSEKKTVLADDAFNLLFCLVILVVALSMLYRQLDAVWDRKQQGKPAEPAAP